MGSESQTKFELLTKSEDWRDHGLVASDKILLSKVTGRIGCHGTSSYGSTLAVGPKRTSECYHHEGPFSQNVCPIFGVLDTDTPLLSTRPLVH